ncbi:MAG TPA: hypothetical protein VHI99_10775 [Vicinamibacterales bacterium]|jgi:hypothetical protein|nr:hypothetical protein [Vicinamibacterales bacterium]
MRKKQLALGGLLGGLTLFIWSFLSHMPPVGTMGYGIPTAFLFGQLVDHVGGWLLAGVVLARVCPPR